MKKIIFFIGFILGLCLISPETAFAQRKVTIKLASLVPENTPWGAALNRMSTEWAAATNGEVILQVYHNGVAGGEADVLRKLRMNQIQGGVFTSFGLSSITPEIMTLSAPFLVRNDAELAVVLASMKPELEAKINEQGFFTLVWAKSGWVKMFSRSPVFVPGDLKKLKVGTSREAPKLTDAFKAMGYQMVEIGMDDMLISLNSGKVDAIYQSPVLVGGLQLFGVARHMASINLAPFMGGIILNQRAWRAIPDQYKPKIQQISQRIANEIDASISQLENDVVKTMRNMPNYSLTVNQLSPEQEQLWYKDIDQALPKLLDNGTFDRDMYRKVEAILQKYRSGQ